MAAARFWRFINVHLPFYWLKMKNGGLLEALPCNVRLTIPFLLIRLWEGF